MYLENVPSHLKKKDNKGTKKNEVVVFAIIAWIIVQKKILLKRETFEHRKIHSISKWRGKKHNYQPMLTMWTSHLQRQQKQPISLRYKTQHTQKWCFILQLLAMRIESYLRSICEAESQELRMRRIFIWHSNQAINMSMWWCSCLLVGVCNITPYFTFSWFNLFLSLLFDNSSK